METIYESNDVKIVVEKVDKWEGKVNINGENLMWISRSELNDFKQELTAVLDKFRI